MSLIPVLPTNRTTPKELSDYAETLRELADRLENGEILAIAWVATRSMENEFETGWVNTTDVKTMELIGYTSILMKRLRDEIDG